MYQHPVKASQPHTKPTKSGSNEQPTPFYKESVCYKVVVS
ncbi:hypothetical protein GCM10007173_37370 [Glutamicibacter ardleyensis]|uniref:Uncharacterized protein n=1 Tax=Glutamicibacter ardleyensis TaxID=225894 RepID=A0ABQ2DW22_9MICC|nr:hypothetical protein GCM10007173_37370 [Glutamicibacter ardleyensis]